MAEGYNALEFTPDFIRDFGGNVAASERAAVIKALGLLNENERHPSLRVHQLNGALEGSWSASAASALRITFLRLPGGRKQLLSCTRQYR